MFKSKAGFTILEILVVLIVMSIIMVFAIGRGRITGADVKVQTEVLKTQLRHAQARAMNDIVPWGIQTDNSGGTSYWLFKYDGSFNKVRLPNEKALTVNLAADGMSMTPGIYSFDSRGIPYYEPDPTASQPSTTPIASAEQPITVSDGTDSYVIRITRNTGFIP
jgi:prepilin-type N-terminal cleavage/methylation domain-containing protein